MNRPYQYTLTQADRILFQKWLLWTSAFWGVVTLLVISVALVSPNRTARTQTETAAVVRSGTQDHCLDRSTRDNPLDKSGEGPAITTFSLVVSRRQCR
jgi:hypothetical protein